MSFVRPQHEDVFVANYLQREIQALGVDSEMRQKFIKYAAREAHANPNKFKARLYHVVNGRTPSAYIALLLVDFFRNRKYEDVVRKVIDHVEYITPDGDTEKLEQFVKKHPLQLRILKVKCQKDEEGITVNAVLRTPIKVPDWGKLNEDVVTEQINAKLHEFQKWLKAQGKLPDRFNFEPGEVVKVEYEPDFFESEEDFSESSNLSGVVDISRGIDLMLLCSLKDKAPCIYRRGLDLFWELKGVLGRKWANKKVEDFSTKELWQNLTRDVNCLPLVFYQEQQYFSQAVALVLGDFFDDFAKRHKKLADRALKDLKEMNQQGELYTAKAEVLRLYEDARQDFAKSLLPLFGSQKKQIVTALLRVMEVYHKRAQERFSKRHGVFESSGT